MADQTVIIIGAGPAGLTAAYELLRRTKIKPIVLECSPMVGGLSCTVEHAGNRIDIGGHRFFSKSDEIMKWWLELMPLAEDYQDDVADTGAIVDRGRNSDEIMLVRRRLSRILYDGRFFDYPLSLSFSTVRNLGMCRTGRIGLSYLRSQLRPVRKEQTLEDFLINRFGYELYATFFRDYTEKVWGIPCREISAEWGVQRIKGLSVAKALTHALKRCLGRGDSFDQKGTETSLIERFYYPKYGPGQLWEKVARICVEQGGRIECEKRVVGVQCEGKRAQSVLVKDEQTGQTERLHANYVFSSMPVRELIGAVSPSVPAEVREVADGLKYRDFLTVGLLLRKLTVSDKTANGASNGLIRDCWLYVQDTRVRLGRIQIFNNWSPYLVKHAGTVWLGLEYFCEEGDDLWSRPDEELISFGLAELEQIGFASKGDYLNGTVIRTEKAYPGYFGTYDRFGVVREFCDEIDNLFLIGRNGMHRYNNMDHSMMTAIKAVDAFVAGEKTRDSIWNVNTEGDYHESR